MSLIGKTPALILGSTATFAIAGGAVPMPAVAAEVRAAASNDDTPRPPRPGGPHRHHFAPTTAAAALVPTTPYRVAQAARGAVGATV